LDDQTHRFSVAPMMDWTENFGNSVKLPGYVCKICTRMFAFSFAFVPVQDRA